MKKIYTGNLVVEVREDSNAEALLLQPRSLANENESLRTTTPTPWDEAYTLKKKEVLVAFAEPDLENSYRFDNPAADERLESAGQRCSRNNDYEAEWPFPKDNTGNPVKKIWHLEDGYSQLKSARDAVAGQKNIIRIAHFDTGYDPLHFTCPEGVMNNPLQKNFVEDELPDRAIDNYSEGLGNMPGHGAGTLSILAGKKVNIPEYQLDDSIGLTDGFEIVPIRLSKSVILFKSKAFTKALRYIISLYDNPATRVHVITMSMGGLASKDWADAVNEAYEKGIFIVTAAGNNMGRATPRTLIYPARFKRVVAACGVTQDYSPYFKPFDILHPFKGMQGNFGPRKVMNTAIAAFTPNMPWAKIGCNEVVSLAGAGTSSATPQVASAAAIYYKKYYDELEAMPEGWMRVEAIRRALFQSAEKKINGYDNDVELYFGNGVLKANDMLQIAPDPSQLVKQEEDKLRWSLLKLFTDINIREAFFTEMADEELMQMMETEVVQLIQQSAGLQALTDNEEKEWEDLSQEDKLKFAQTILAMPEASARLKELIQKMLEQETT